MDKDKIIEGVKLILEGIGEDPVREGLIETPERVAKMYEELVCGYKSSIRCVSTTFYRFMDALQSHIFRTERLSGSARCPERSRYLPRDCNCRSD